MKNPGEFSKRERVLSVLSGIWLIVIFVIALDQSNGRLDNFFGIFLIVGLVPVLVIAGLKWIRNAPKVD